MSRLFTCLIRTHHITSRKKLARVKKAAAQHDVDLVLVRYGGSPGIMYGESLDRQGLDDWVSTVQSLRYKDFQCLRRPEPHEGRGRLTETGFNEVDTVKEFSDKMDERGLMEWWKKAMGYQA